MRTHPSAPSFPPRPSSPSRILRRALLASALALLAGAGCRLEVVRVRGGRSLDEAGFERLEVGTSTLDEALSRLGAPDKLEWKEGSREDYLWYLYADDVLVGLRFLFPPFRSISGYQHTVLRLQEDSEELNAIQLVFDEEGVLRSKSLRLSEAYAPPAEEESRWRLRLTPYGDYGLLLMGDGGVEDYSEMFRDGYRAGLQLGIQPFPACTFLVAGSYQEHQGQGFVRSKRIIRPGDLWLAQGEVGIRVQIPFSVVADLGSLEKLKRALFAENLEKPRGLCLFIQGSTGASVNGDVRVEVDGERDGTLYESDFLFSGNASAGIEYDTSRLAFSAGITYQAVDAFEKGDSSVASDAGAFEVLFVGGGLTIKF